MIGEVGIPANVGLTQFFVSRENEERKESVENRYTLGRHPGAGLPEACAGWHAQPPIFFFSAGQRWPSWPPWTTWPSWSQGDDPAL